MTVTPSDLRSLPLFAGMGDEPLSKLLQAFQQRTYELGNTLFEEGSLADTFLVLSSGEVAIRQGGQERFRLHPIAPVGELGALVGFRRQYSAVATINTEVLALSSNDLLNFFDTHSEVAYPFHRNLMHVIADKITRDRDRMDEMRNHIITTQKSMKRMREALLDAEDNALHRMFFEELDANIEQNRKGHYLVHVAKALPTSIKFDDGSKHSIDRISNEWIIFNADGAAFSRGASWSGVLSTPEDEIPVSGTIEQIKGDLIVLYLDMLIDDFNQKLESHLTKLQMLDVVL